MSTPLKSLLYRNGGVYFSMTNCTMDKEGSIFVSDSMRTLASTIHKHPPELFYKKISQNSHENTYARVSFLIKLQLYQKRDSGMGVFA